MKFGRSKSRREIVSAGMEEIFPRLWRYCLVLCADRSFADDLAQAACLRALEKADGFQPGTYLDRWMFRLTHRLWLNELRSRAVRRGGGLASIEEADLIDARPDPESQMLNKEVVVEMMRLPEAQRATMLLVYVEGYSYRDAAMILDIPVGTVMSRLSIARGRLAQKFRSHSETGS